MSKLATVCAALAGAMATHAGTASNAEAAGAFVRCLGGPAGKALSAAAGIE